MRRCKTIPPSQKNYPSASPFGSDGVQFIDEDDGRRLFFGQSEGVSDEFSAISDEHLHQLRPSQLQKRGFGLRGAGTSQQGLTGAGRAVKQDAFRRLNAEIDEP